MQRYLIIRLSALGDVAMLCSVIREVATQHPENSYTLLSRPKMSDLLIDMPDNVHFLAWDKQTSVPDIAWSTFDCVIDAHRVWRTLRLDAIALLHGKRIRVLHKSHIRKWLRCHGFHPSITPMLTRYQKLFNSCSA